QLICYEEPPITREHALKSLGLLPSKLFFKLDEAAGKSDLPFAFELSAELFEMGCHLEHFLESLTQHYRNIALVQMGKKAALNYRQSAQLYSSEQCLAILDYLLDMQEKMQRSPFKRVHLEIILLHILRSKKKITIGTLVDRLEKLKELAPASQVKEKVAPQIEEKVEEVPFFPNTPEPELPSQPTESKKPEPPSQPTETQTPEATPPEPTETQTPEATSPKPTETQTPEETTPQLTDIKKKIRHERVMRFATVELNGSIV
nr:hypothetical protein [Chlamydiota bacterium]